MVFIRKDRAGASAGYVWEKDGAIVEVADHDADGLLAIPDAGFTEIRPDQLDEPMPGTPAGDISDLIKSEVARHTDDLRDELAQGLAVGLAELRRELLSVVGAGGVKDLTAEGPAAPAVVSPPGVSSDGAEASAAAGADAPGGAKAPSGPGRPGAGGTGKR